MSTRVQVTYVDEELAQYRRKLRSAEHAPLEHRMTDPSAWIRNVEHLQQRIAELELERDLLIREAELLEEE